MVFGVRVHGVGELIVAEDVVDHGPKDGPGVLGLHDGVEKLRQDCSVEPMNDAWSIMTQPGSVASARKWSRYQTCRRRCGRSGTTEHSSRRGDRGLWGRGGRCQWFAAERRGRHETAAGPVGKLQQIVADTTCHETCIDNFVQQLRFYKG